MSFGYLPILEIFMGILGFGLSILFCTTFCRACSRFREEQIERDLWRRNEHDGRPPSIYFIPFHGNVGPQDGEDHHPRLPGYSQDPHMATQFPPAAYCGPPPSYNELGLKPDDLPPAYTEYVGPVHTSDMVSPNTQTQSQS